MRASAIFVLLALAACSSGQKERQAPQPTAVAFNGAQADTSAARIAHGERLTRVLGCRGCHGQDLQGQRFYELYASNLTRDVPNYSDIQLDRLIRHGERVDHRDVWGMPSEIFQHLSDPDFAALTAYLRTLRPGGGPDQARLPWAPDAAALIAKGELKPAAQGVVAARAKVPPDLGPGRALGRYITMTTCAECHGPELKGHEGETPDLIVAGGYTRAEFDRLITQGIPTGGRKIRAMMSGVALDRFSHLTIQERYALYAYLKERAERK